jgi:hypothetical protein
MGTAKKTKPKELSERQRRALLLAYADGWTCEEALITDDDPDAVNPSTLRSLLRAGLVEPAPRGKDGHVATAAGRAALGVALEPPPADLPEALARAVDAIFGPGSMEDPGIDVRFGKDCDRELIADDTWFDFRGARATVKALYWGRSELEWAAVGTAITDLGFPVTTEVTPRGLEIAAFWPAEGRRRRRRR